MADISRTALFGKLNSLAYKSVESATVFCKMRGNPYVELVHWLNMVLQLQDSDLHRIVKHYDLNPSRLASDMTSSLDSLPRGATSISDFSPHLEEAVERAWVYSTLLFGESQVRTGHMVIALLKTPGLKAVLPGISAEFRKIKVEDLSDKFASVVGGSPEDALAAQDGSRVGGGVAPGEASGAVAPAVMGKQEALAQFSVDLTETARKGSSTRSWAATTRSGRLSTSSCAVVRIIPSSPVRPVWVRQRLWRDSPSASSRETSRRRSGTSRCAPSIWDCSRPGRA